MVLPRRLSRRWSYVKNACDDLLNNDNNIVFTSTSRPVIVVDYTSKAANTRLNLSALASSSIDSHVMYTYTIMINEGRHYVFLL